MHWKPTGEWPSFPGQEEPTFHGGSAHMATPMQCCQQQSAVVGGGAGVTRVHLAHTGSSERASWESFLEKVLPVSLDFIRISRSLLQEEAFEQRISQQCKLHRVRIKKKKVLFIYFQREGEREVEKHQLHASNWDPARNPGMCSDWEWNQRPFGLQADPQSTEPHQPGQKFCLVYYPVPRRVVGT